MSFSTTRAQSAGAGVMESILGLANTQYNPGDMLSVTAGIATKATATSKGTHVFNAVKTDPSLLRPLSPNATTGRGERVLAEKISGTTCHVVSQLLTALMDLYSVASAANTVANTVVIPSATGTNGNFVGGLLYIAELNQTFLITASTYAALAYTFTVQGPIGSYANPLTIGTGYTISVLPWAQGYFGVKFASSNPSQGLDPSLANATGGFNKIEAVDFKNLLIYSSVPDNH